MNNNAKLWVAALESGKYKQTTGCLARKAELGEITYCCLGVACEVARENGIAISQEEEHGKILFDNWEGSLPDKVREWLGLNYSNGDFGPTNLADQNDGGATFPEIAALIKSEPEGLFEKE